MKAQILITVLLGLMLGACSSSKKATEAKADAETKVEETKGNAEKAAGEAKDKAKAAVSEEVSCAQGSDKRTIGIKAVDQGCEVIYTKFGESTSIASGSKGSDHCASVVIKVKENLQNAGFKCE